MPTAADQMLLMVDLPRGQVLPNYATHEALLADRLAQLLREAREDGDNPADLLDDLLGVEAHVLTDTDLVALVLNQPAYRRALGALRGAWTERESLVPYNPRARPTADDDNDDEGSPADQWQTLELDPTDPTVSVTASRAVALSHPDEDAETRDLRAQAELWYKEMTFRGLLEQLAMLT
jgi:hypothetical protein